MPEYLIKALFAVIGLMLEKQLFTLLPHAKHPAARFFVNAVIGLACLLIANVIGSAFGLGLGLNAVTVPAAAVLGIPGVAVMWLFCYLL